MEKKLNLKRFPVFFTIVFCVLTVIAVSIGAISSGNSSPETETVPPSAATQVVVAVEKIESEIPKDVFGGLYIDDDGTIVVNVTKIDERKIASINSAVSGQNIVYHIVDLPLATLEAAHYALVPYMVEYRIATLDANDVTNKLDIELYEYREGLEELVSQFIDLKYVNISVFPEGWTLKYTYGYIDDIPEDREYKQDTMRFSGNARRLRRVVP